MAMRARLVISGNVQGVGYRTLVKQIACRLNITGIVRNLQSNEVEIYCQCPNRPILDEFIKKIAVKARTEDIFAVNVESVKLYDDKDEKFGEPKADFDAFKIDYGMNVDNYQKESLERSEIGILLLSGTRFDIQAMHTDLKSGFKETKTGLADVKNEVTSMHGDMNKRFDTLDNKYGEISHKMNDLTTELQKSTNALVAMTEKVGALIDKKLAE